MKKTTKIIITLTIAIILIGVASFLIYGDFFGSSKNNESNNKQGLSENDDLKAEESDVYTEETEEADEKSDNDNEIQEQNDGVEKESDSNSVAEDGENDSDTGITSEDKNADSLRADYDKILKSGKPSIIVFSYDADCCASTKAFFDEYNGSVKEIMRKYSDNFNTLFINTGTLDDKDMDTAVEIASGNNVVNLPSILILDKSGSAYKVIEGVFDEEEVKEILKGMIDG